MARYIYQHEDWPSFQWDKDTISHELAAVRHRQGRLLSLRKVDEIRGVFKASRSASAIQMIRLHAIPALLAFTSTAGRCWSIGGPRVPRGLKTRPDIGSESYAFEILHNSAPDQPNPRQIRADVWFDRRGSDRFRVTEQSFAVSDNTVATLISFTDPQMLEIYKDGW